MLGNYFVESSSVVVIEDLKKQVTPTSPIWLSQAEVQRSICLGVLIKMGVVRVTSKNRSQEERVSKPPKPPAPPSVRLSRPNRAVRAAPKQITLQEAQELANSAAEVAAKNAVDGVMARLEAPAPVQGGLSPEQLEEALVKALAGVQLASAGRGEASQITGPEEPVFIPKGIVKAESEDLDIQSSSSEDKALGSAASALKALKGKRKRKSKKE